MAWIKRNLLFLIGVAIAAGLLACAVLYSLENWQRNNAAMSALNEAYSTLQSLNNERPSPGEGTVNNIQTAREQEQQLKGWIQQAKRYFKPIPPIPNPPNGVVTSEAFAAALRRTIDQLQHDANDASVTVPPQYNFSFEAERSLVKFSPGGLGLLAQQLGSVKKICGVLFAAKVNSLDGLRRVRVSQDDARGSQSDYLGGSGFKNNLATFMPYEVTFRCFSRDLANVLSGFASSPHEFIVTDINVQPASTMTSSTSPSGRFGGEVMGSRSSPYAPFYRSAYPRAYQSPAAPVNEGGLQTVLKEQLLSITLKIVVVRLSPDV